MTPTDQRRLLAYAAQLPPSRARMVVDAIAAKTQETPPQTTAFDDALEAMAEAMEQRIADELMQQFLA